MEVVVGVEMLEVVVEVGKGLRGIGGWAVLLPVVTGGLSERDCPDLGGSGVME